MTLSDLDNRGFICGAGTSSYQIEGGWDADGKGPSIWDVHSRRPGAVYRGHTGDAACEHYHRYREDVALMKELGLQAYRFSINWPRVLPEGVGRVNEAGLAFYDRLVDELLGAGIEPWVTLYHWELPWSLHLRGGWLNPAMPGRVEAFAALVAERLGDRVTKWITLNEPQVFIGLGYASGTHAPGYRLSLRECLQAGHHAMLAHHAAVRTIRSGAKQAVEIGSAPVGVVCRPASESEADIEAARQATLEIRPPTSHTADAILGSLWNSTWWMDAMALGHYPEHGLKAFSGFLPDNAQEELKAVFEPTDFVGANIYHGRTVEATADGGFRFVDPPAGSPRTTMGWDITPDILYWGGKFLHERYRKPLYITENGIAVSDLPDDAGAVDDATRGQFIKEHLRGIRRARAEGIPYLGYFHWSLMDNFEWEHGYSQRFGIVHVDFQSQKRVIKRSGKNFARLVDEVVRRGLPS